MKEGYQSSQRGHHNDDGQTDVEQLGAFLYEPDDRGPDEVKLLFNAQRPEVAETDEVRRTGEIMRSEADDDWAGMLTQQRVWRKEVTEVGCSGEEIGVSDEVEEWREQQQEQP
jgi:hypothetical protein